MEALGSRVNRGEKEAKAVLLCPVNHITPPSLDLLESSRTMCKIHIVSYPLREVSVLMKDALYTIALLNADHYEALARRAQRSDDEELAEFFRAMRDHNRHNSEKALTLLAQRVTE